MPLDQVLRLEGRLRHGDAERPGEGGAVEFHIIAPVRRAGFTNVFAAGVVAGLAWIGDDAAGPGLVIERRRPVRQPGGDDARGARKIEAVIGVFVERAAARAAGVEIKRAAMEVFAQPGDLAPQHRRRAEILDNCGLDGVVDGGHRGAPCRCHKLEPALPCDDGGRRWWLCSDVQATLSPVPSWAAMAAVILPSRTVTLASCPWGT